MEQQISLRGSSNGSATFSIIVFFELAREANCYPVDVPIEIVYFCWCWLPFVLMTPSGQGFAEDGDSKTVFCHAMRRSHADHVIVIALPVQRSGKNGCGHKPTFWDIYISHNPSWYTAPLGFSSTGRSSASLETRIGVDRIVSVVVFYHLHLSQGNG